MTGEEFLTLRDSQREENAPAFHNLVDEAIAHALDQGYVTVELDADGEPIVTLTEKGRAHLRERAN